MPLFSLFTQRPSKGACVIALVLVLFVANSLPGCATSTPPAGPTPAAGPGPQPEQSTQQHSTQKTEEPAATKPAAIPETSESAWQLVEGNLVVHVGKAGRLARLGHNHLVSSSQLTGTAWLGADSALHADVQLAVATLSVDDPELRDHYSSTIADQRSSRRWIGQYSSVPSAKNIADTRFNMLGPRVLQADIHPSVSVRLRAPDAREELTAAAAGSLNATLAIQVRDVRTSLPLTLNWSRSNANEMHFQTEFDVTHSSLGLSPFSALGGALSVAELLSLEVSGVVKRSGSVQIDGTTVEHQET